MESRKPTTLTAAVLTISDSVSRGEKADLSGPALAGELKAAGITVLSQEVVPDELHRIQAAVLQLSEMADVVVATGGTGVALRDVTPEAVSAVCERLLPGMAEVMRTEGRKTTPYAALSRAVCGVRGRALIVTLPGSPQGALESLRAVLPLFHHVVDQLRGGSHQ